MWVFSTNTETVATLSLALVGMNSRPVKRGLNPDMPVLKPPLTFSSALITLPRIKCHSFSPPFAGAGAHSSVQFFRES